MYKFSNNLAPHSSFVTDSGASELKVNLDQKNIKIPDNLKIHDEINSKFRKIFIFNQA